MSRSFTPARRRFLHSAAFTAGGLITGLPGILRAQQAPAVIASDSTRPSASWGLQIGDVLGDRAIIWSRSDRPARMLVDWSLDESFGRAVRVRGPHALDESDYTDRVDLTGLPPGQDIFVRVLFEELDSGQAQSEPVLGRLRTPPRGHRSIRFVWGGDTVGQGWGINPDDGGMRIYEAMRQVQPDFFLHCGDTIYADGPLSDSVTLADGSVWHNAFLDAVPEKRKVAETLTEYRRHYLYNLYDENVRRFNAEVPQIWQWDDHEVVNNWSPSKDLSADARYTEKRVHTLVANGTRAFLDYAPMRWHGQAEAERVYRQIPYGSDLELFVLDMRSYRGPNTYNRQERPDEETVFLGREQIAWLKRALLASRATWKVIAADMPLGLQVTDGVDAQGRTRYENSANGDGPVLGREFEIAEILRFIKHQKIRNTVWLTADVHYCAAHHYDPARAQFQDFDPFWEFVAGPLHAGTFGPSLLDNTFGPQVVFQKTPAPGEANLPPSAGLQFFGQVDIDPGRKDFIVSLKDSTGATVFATQLRAA